uniref:Serine-threonine/tyrosine-protein kinase catalytic domain-containing protein n=1 Tax=Romanomermis culicivorax TaxID=13658 RepID=A0A915KBA7_ROMCU
MSLGQQPYIGKSNFETMNFVRLGGRLEPPEACPQDIYHIMTQCWDSLPSNRKSFVKICDEISAMKSRTIVKHCTNTSFLPLDQSHRSLRRSGREKISKIFSSLRRKSEQPPPPVLPSKDVFEKPNVENESRRSDSAMSFTTTATGYEVALLKRQNNGAKIEFDHFTNDGIDNYGYCSSSATVYGSVDKKDEKPAPKMLVTEI